MIYVASRVKHAPMWRDLGLKYPIISTWIDEDGEGQTADFSELWLRIRREIGSADALVMYVEPCDFPMKGALVEVGMALAIGLRVYVAAPGVKLEGRIKRPLGSWVEHPNVTLEDWLTLDMAMQLAASEFGVVDWGDVQKPKE